MPYNTNFPLQFDFMRDSQPLMLQNFANIFSFIGEDHEDFNTGNAGKHAQTTFPMQPNDPLNTSEWKLFCKRSPFSNIINLFARDSSTNIFGFTDKYISPGLTLTSWVQLPSGLIIKWTFVGQQRQYDNPLTLNWSNRADNKPFTTQLWSAIDAINPINASRYTDVDAMFYVLSVATPTSISYQCWKRAAFSEKATNLPAHLIVSIGV